ncbi:DUF2637 domain-containing protein [Streptomyces sp. cg36]|uniref:DUF2637 domain-containing protein n=1 Tax=Streptomyces sp. cg36 TaxID=3238798 RepID=UPI0034E286A2
MPHPSLPARTLSTSARSVTGWDRAAVIALGSAGCALSYDALQQMAVAIHVRGPLTYLFPLVIDGFIAYGVRALLVLSTAPLPARLYVWTLFGTATAASIWANALHAVRLNQQTPDSGLHLGDTVVATLSTLAPLALAGAVHLYILITRHHPAGANTVQSTTGHNAPGPTPHQPPVPTPPHTSGDRAPGTGSPEGEQAVVPETPAANPGTVPTAESGTAPTRIDEPHNSQWDRTSNGDRDDGDGPSARPGVRSSGDRSPTHSGGDPADGPRPHPLPLGDQPMGTDVPENQSPHSPGGPARPRPRLSDDEIAERLRPHAQARLTRDGNPHLTRAQLRELLRAHNIPLRNDRMATVLQRLNTHTDPTHTPRSADR